MILCVQDILINAAFPFPKIHVTVLMIEWKKLTSVSNSQKNEISLFVLAVGNSINYFGHIKQQRNHGFTIGEVVLSNQAHIDFFKL